MGKIKLRRSRTKNKLTLLFFILVFSVFIAFISVIHISEKLTPILLELATMKLNKYSTTIVNKAVSQVLDDKIEIDSLFEIVKNKNDEIQMIDFDTSKVNHALNIATTVVQNNIKVLESGDVPSVVDDELEHDEVNNLAKGIVVEVPVGRALGITFLANLGPMIPIRFHYIGDVNSNIETKVTAYGLNNALVEINMRLEMTAQIYLPFQTEVKTIECTIPLVIKMINGTVPNYYSGRFKTNSNLYSNSLE